MRWRSHSFGVSQATLGCSCGWRCGGLHRIRCWWPHRLHLRILGLCRQGVHVGNHGANLPGGATVQSDPALCWGLHHSAPLLRAPWFPRRPRQSTQSSRRSNPELHHGMLVASGHGVAGVSEHRSMSTWQSSYSWLRCNYISCSQVSSYGHSYQNSNR